MDFAFVQVLSWKLKDYSGLGGVLIFCNSNIIDLLFGLSPSWIFCNQIMTSILHAAVKPPTENLYTNIDTANSCTPNQTGMPYLYLLFPSDVLKIQIWLKPEKAWSLGNH